MEKFSEILRLQSLLLVAVLLPVVKEKGASSCKLCLHLSVLIPSVSSRGEAYLYPENLRLANSGFLIFKL